MALVMVHLLVAREWAALHPEYLNAPEYYFGAIAPDAIHIRDGNDKSRKNAVHYMNWGGSHPESILEYWLSRRNPFDVGYAIHCLTDGLWVDGYRSAFPGLLTPDGKTKPTLYYNDVYATERELFAATPETGAMLRMISQANAPEDHPQLLAAEFNQWRCNVLREYDLTSPAIGAWRYKSYLEMGLPEPDDKDPLFITPQYIHRFMRETASAIDAIIRRFEA